MIHIRISKILLLLCCTLLAGLPGVSNVLDYGVNLVNVQHVLSMDEHIIETSAKTWKAINSPFIHQLFYLLIICGELITLVLGIWGSIDLWRSRHNVQAFNKNKVKGIWALNTGILVFLLGFMVVGGEWFMMWLAPEWNSQQSAFRIVVPFMLALIFISMKDEEF